MKSKIKLADVIAAMLIAIFFIAILVMKLMQNAAHRDGLFDWQYIFSSGNIASALVILGLSVASYVTYRFIKKKLRNRNKN